MSKKIPDFFKKVVFWASRPSTTQRDEYAALVSLLSNDKKPTVVTVPLGNGNRGYYIDRTHRDWIFEYLKEVFKDAESMQKHIDEYEAVEKFREETIEKIKRTNTDSKEILIAYKMWLTLMPKIAPYAWMPWVLEDYFTPVYLAKLQGTYPKTYEDIYAAITSPTELIDYQKIRIAVCDTAVAPLSERKARISDLAQNYSWGGEYSFVETLWDETYFEKEVGSLTADQARIEKESILSHIEEGKKHFEKTRDEITDPYLKAGAKFINKYIYLRTARVDIFKKVQVHVRGLFQKMARSMSESGTSVDAKDMAYLMNREVIAYLESGVLPDIDALKKRTTGLFVFYYRQGETETITEEDFVTEVVEIVTKVETDTNIKGTPAFKGKVTGQIALVFSKEDLGKVKQGNILVARTTMPDYTPAMKIASAFVTDEGGITSHAAIVARELKKPCIVGTKIATKVLKDGDMVEVDADKGVVRIIK